jgi:UDP-N-acetylmuramoyl-L-alanyl-D-glutamate--2,6-diaminopimelate ligase
LALTLRDLLEGAGPLTIAGSPDVEISDITHDSRRAQRGSLFFALPGSKTDGHLHVKSAVEKGSVAIVSELPPPPPPALIGAAWVQVRDAAASMGKIADRFYGHPSRAMTVFGVTGTNGKTTVTYFLESIARASGLKAGVVGTVSCRLGGEDIEKSPNTTPIASELLRLLARMRDAGASQIAMEVSSHALALRRADEIDFDAAIFTNLGRDHLDFHKTEEEYLRAKLRLFELLGKVSSSKKDRVGLVNAHDPRSRIFCRALLGVPCLSYGLIEGCDVRAAHSASDVAGSRFLLRWREWSLPVEIKIIGDYNILNALAAAGAALALHADPRRVQEGLASLESVPGRLEPVRAGQDFSVFVDYAHTEEALRSALLALKNLPHKKMISVFGCGGDRDKTKRAPMGIAGCELSDLAILTSDNPRTEDPHQILGEIEEGPRARGLGNYRVEVDRTKAIHAALSAARGGDIVLIAGKGHEDYQILRECTIPFSDKEVARRFLQKHA